MQVLERTLERRCVAYAKDRGWRSKKMVAAFDNHWPDRLFVGPRGAGTPILFIEFKRQGQKATEIQERVLRDLRERGQVALVVTSFEQFKDIIDEAT